MSPDGLQHQCAAVTPWWLGGGLAAIAEGGEQHRYRGTIEWVRRGAQMQNISIPLPAVAKSKGVEVGGGGGGYCGREWKQNLV